MSYHISDYPPISNSKKYRSSSSFSWGGGLKFSAAGGDRGGVCISTNHFSYQKSCLVTGMNDIGFEPYQSHCTASSLVSYWIRDYPIGDYYGSSFIVAAGGGRSGIGPRNTHLSSQKVDCWFDGSYFVSYHSSLS